jgi:hypothetical protein
MYAYGAYGATIGLSFSALRRAWLAQISQLGPIRKDFVPGDQGGRGS